MALATCRVFVFRAINFVRQFFNRAHGYTRYFPCSYLGGYGANGSGIDPVGGIEEPPLPRSVHSFWVGHVTDTSAVITARILNPDLNVTLYFLQITTDPNFNFTIGSNVPGFPDPFDRQFGLIRFNISSDLNPNTRYYFRIFVPPNLTNAQTYIGSFKTAKSGTLNNSFKLAFGSCSDTASNALLFDNLRTKATDGDLDFFVHLGDMHYRDIVQNQESRFQDAYNRVFSSPRQNNCWKNLPMYYMWDDHDYGPNDTDKNSPSRNAAIAAYRRRVPYPPLAITADSTGGVGNSPYFSFVRGRVRFIVTDIRSEREPKGTYASTNALQQVFSNDQKQWFFDQMLAAKDNNQIIIWANTKPWVSSIQNGKDDWGGYHYARMEIVNFINTNELTDRIVIISGDMHALAYDDGTSPNNYGNLKVCHGAPLDQQIRFKGGPYTVGPIATNGSNGYATQYGILEIDDTGEALINVRFKGVNIDRTSGAETTPIDVNFDLNSGYAPPPPPPIPSGYLAFWKLSNVTDSSPNENTLTNNGGVQFVAGKVGNCADFNGSNYLSSTQGVPTGDFTLSYWLKLNSFTADQVVGQLAFGCAFFGSGSDIYFANDSSALVQIIGPVNLGQWNHVVVTRSGNTFDMWTNGVLRNTQISNVVSSSSQMQFGTGHTCQIDAFGIWSRSLTTEEIAILYNNGNGIE